MNIRRKYISNLLISIYFSTILWHYFISNIIIVVFGVGLLTVVSALCTFKIANIFHLLIFALIVGWSLLLGILKGYIDYTPLLLLPSYFIAYNIYKKYF